MEIHKNFNRVGRQRDKKIRENGSSLRVQWLGFSVFTATAWVHSLVKELRSHKPHGTTKKKAGWGREELEKMPRRSNTWPQEFKKREKELPWQFSG